MGRAVFDNAGFLGAARALACERGPGAVTVDSVTQRLRAPKGSFYHRFASRDALLGELWLETVLAYQEGFVAARASLLLRPIGSLSSPRPPSSQGSNPASYPAEPPASFRTNRQLSG
jgi:AcrR family transcriptional regulator